MDTARTPPSSASNTDQLERLQRAIESAAAGPLAAFLHGQRWFGGKGRAVRSVRVRDFAVVDAGTLGRPQYALVLFEVAQDDDHVDLYSVPLVVGTGGASTADSIVGEIELDGAPLTIADACADDRFARALFAVVARNRTITSARGGAIVGSALGSIVGLLGGDAIESLVVKRLRAEQSNTSIVFSPGGRDRVVVKCLRKLPEGVGVEAELGGLLTRVGFKGAPTTLGDLAYVPPRTKGERVEPITLAVAQSFVANVGDGWGHALADLRTRFDSGGRSSRPSREPYDVAMRALGNTIAEMHLALAGDDKTAAFAPEPIDADDSTRIATSAANRLLGIVEWIRESIERWPEELRPLALDVAERAPILSEQLRSARRLASGLRKIRVHGDLHLGQVLRVHHDDGRAGWVVVDFEGEPMRPLSERRAKSSPLRDVAGMLRSFDYAAFAAVREATAEAKLETPVSDLQRVAQTWRDAARSAFLDGWLSVASKAGAGFVPSDERERVEALSLFELDKALYELAYEIENRPDWIGIPLRGIHALVGER